MIPQLYINSSLIQEAMAYYRKSKLDDRWDLFIETSLKPQRRYIRKMRQIFNAQLDDVVGMLNRKQVKAVYDAEQIDWHEYRLQYSEFGQLELPGIISGWAELELQALQVGINFDVTFPEVVESITKRSNKFADSIINETRDSLHQVLIDSINAGDSIPQMEKKIRLLYENMSKYRSTRIARTEAIWAQNEGSEQSYIQSGVIQYKKWFCAKDERLCGYCEAMGRQEPIRVGTNYFDQGAFFQPNADLTPMRLNYENVSHPPLHPHCYAVNTEIYTKAGWKQIHEIEKDELVLSLVPETKDLEWVKVTQTIKHFSPTIFHLRNKQRSFEMMVTGDHPFFGYKRVDEGKKGRNIKPVLFDGVNSLNSEFRFYLSSKYFRLSPSHISINGAIFEIKQFCKFMGYYLSEGSVCKRKKGQYQISIAQSHYLDEMWDDLKGLPVRKIYLGKDRITIRDQALGLYLEQFGKSNEKYVPEEIKNLSPMDIRVFLDAYGLGDGNIKKSNQWKGGSFKDSITYFTSSDKLAGDLGELIIKTGKSVSYSVDKRKGTKQDFRNGSYIINYDLWRIYELTSQYRLFDKVSIEELPYNDLVYDIEVEKNHTILTRYGGKVVWGSNCRCRIIAVVEL